MGSENVLSCIYCELLLLSVFILPIYVDHNSAEDDCE